MPLRKRRYKKVIKLIPFINYDQVDLDSNFLIRQLSKSAFFACRVLKMFFFTISFSKVAR